jgi:hypothetical protein
MNHFSLRLVATLSAVIASPALLTAEDIAPNAGPVIGTNRPAGRVAQSERQVFVQGVVDLDFLSQNNYGDGNSDERDHRNEGLIRGELGARLELDERVEVKVTVAYDAETGDDTNLTGDSSDGNRGDVVMDDAYVVLKDLFNQPELSLKAGRHPVSWNLRRDYGAFLFDSRANDPDVTSWDGARGQYNLETIIISPYLYEMQDQSRLYGLAVDWQPEEGANNGLFLTGSLNMQRDVVVPGGTGDSLTTFYGGGEMRFDSGFDLFVEGALQRGREDGDIDFRGYGFSFGIDFHAPTVNQMVFGLQFDYLSGDDDASDAKNRNFINPFEAVSDLYIVENEKYGEVSEYLQGDLEAAKAKAEVAIDRDNRLRVKGAYGMYRTAEEAGNGSQNFGQEFDLTFTWQYTYNATFNLFGAMFLPDNAFEAVAPGADNDTDPITLFGVNLLVSF